MCQEGFHELEENRKNQWLVNEVNSTDPQRKGSLVDGR